MVFRASGTRKERRGQDGAGLATINIESPVGSRYISRYRSNSAKPIQDLFEHVNSRFSELRQINSKRYNDTKWLQENKAFTGEVLLGHLRYGTYGGNSIEHCHPFLRQSNWRTRSLVLAGNFNMTNVDELFSQLVDLGQHPKEKADTVTILEKIGHFLDEENDRIYYNNKGKISQKEMSDKIANELSLNSWIKGSGYEYRRLDLYKETKPFFIIPIDFPSKPSVIRTHSHLQYSTEELKHWDMAPDNLKYLSNAGLEFSITSDNLKKKSQFRVNLRKMIDRGLDQSTLLAALTTIPAAAIGMEKSLGKIAPGYDANLVIVDGEYFDPKSKILSVWVNGEKNYISSNNSEKFQGTWSLKYNGSAYELKIEKPNKQKLNDKNKSNLIPSNSSYIGSLKLNEKSITINNIDIFDNTISFTVDGTKFKLKGTLSFSGDLENRKI